MKKKLNNKYTGWELEHFDNSKNYRNYQYSLIKKHIKKNTAEIGPGNGKNLNLYLKDATKIKLYEPQKKLFENLKKKFRKNKKISIFNQKFKLEKNTFDTIIYLDVLEHIKNDKEEILKSFKSLKKGGNLIINVPAFPHLYSKFDNDVGHYRRYNYKMLVNLTKKIKFSSLRTLHFDSIGYFLSLISKIFSSNYKKNFALKIKFWDSLIFLSKFIDKITMNSFGKSLLIIIRK